MSATPGNAFRAFVAKGLDDIMPGRRALSYLASFAINVALIAAVFNMARSRPTPTGGASGPRPKP